MNKNLYFTCWLVFTSIISLWDFLYGASVISASIYAISLLTLAALAIRAEARKNPDDQ